MTKISWTYDCFTFSRIAIIELCGWCNKKGNATPTGKRIAKTEWENLSPAAKRILTNHGIEK